MAVPTLAIIIIIWILFNVVHSIEAFFLEMTFEGLSGYIVMIDVLIFIATMLIELFNISAIKVILRQGGGLGNIIQERQILINFVV